MRQMLVIKVEKNREGKKGGMKDYFREDSRGSPEQIFGREKRAMRALRGEYCNGTEEQGPVLRNGYQIR